MFKSGSAYFSSTKTYAPECCPINAHFSDRLTFALALKHQTEALQCSDRHCLQHVDVQFPRHHFVRWVGQGALQQLLTCVSIASNEIDRDPTL